MVISSILGCTYVHMLEKFPEMTVKASYSQARPFFVFNNLMLHMAKKGLAKGQF